jgi:hypothetical protein
MVLLEIDELHLQISDRPEERAVETFASNRSNQPFDEWMRERTHGTVSISFTSSIRRFACRQRVNEEDGQVANGAS